jgi:DMSO/TMAO reductase YedYZ molybdopterin-dependent catalytic subunit
MTSVNLDPKGLIKRDPLVPHQMRDRVTRTHETIVLCHLGVPRLVRDRWSLLIDGMVGRTLVLPLEELMRYPKADMGAVHQCCGSALAPFSPTRRVCNVRWAGARLADVLADCRPSTAAKYVGSYGADYGEFGGVVVDAYVKDLPIARVAEDVLIAYQMNGGELPAEHGFPARLVVPGFYGTNNVKWLTRITLAESRAPGPFTTRWYNDPVVDGFGRETGETTPVWSIAPESVIVSPAPYETIGLADAHEIWARADGGVRNVYVRSEDTATWYPADIEPWRGREWQRFSISWTSARRGELRLSSLAEAANGVLQPIFGRRNAVYEVPVTVA